MTNSALSDLFIVKQTVQSKEFLKHSWHLNREAVSEVARTGWPSFFCSGVALGHSQGSTEQSSRGLAVAKSLLASLRVYHNLKCDILFRTKESRIIWVYNLWQTQTSLPPTASVSNIYTYVILIFFVAKPLYVATTILFEPKDLESMFLKEISISFK